MPAGQGVKPYNQKILMESFQPLSSGTSFLRSLPYTANAAQRRRLNTSYPTDKNHIIKEYLKTPPLCFAQQNIGEVARSDGGVEKHRQQQTGYHTLPPPCPVTLRGVAQPYRGGVRKTERLKNICNKGNVSRKLSAHLLHATKKIKETTKTKDVEKRDL